MHRLLQQINKNEKHNKVLQRIKKKSIYSCSKACTIDTFE